MSQQQPQAINQSQEQQYKKTKQQRQKQKASTSAWQKKQQEKKKKKLQEQQPKEQNNTQTDQKALQKAKRKQQKRLQREQMLQEQREQAEQKPREQTKTNKDQQDKQQKKQENNQNKTPQPTQPLVDKAIKRCSQQLPSTKTQSSPINLTKLNRRLSKQLVHVQQQVTVAPKTVVYNQLLTLQQHIRNKSLSYQMNKPTQLLHKYLDQYVMVSDTILVLAKTDSWTPSVSGFKRVYLYPLHEGYQKTSQFQSQAITCTYEDIAYLMQGTLTKIFVQLDVIFGNGVGLTQKGNQNIIALANEFKIPVIGYTGSWCYNAWNYLSLSIFMNRYGQQNVQKYDILQSQSFDIIVMEIGSVIPKQISGHYQSLTKIYRGVDMNSIKW